MVPHHAKTLCTFCFLLPLFLTGCWDNSTGPERDQDSQPGVISGYVTATDDRGGVREARLELVQDDSLLQEVHTINDGSFAFSNVDPGEYEVTATLPQGFREVEPMSKTVSVDGDVTIEFHGEPIQSDTLITQAGQQDTVATASGAFLAIDASNGSTGIEVILSETEEESNTEDENSKTVKINVRPAGSSTSSQSSIVQMAKGLNASGDNSIKLSIGQRATNNDLNTWEFTVPHNNTSIPFFAEATTKTIVDPETQASVLYFSHPFNLSPNVETEFTATVTISDQSCKDRDDLRQLDPVPTDNDGEIALILVHGLQLDKNNCDDFENFSSLDLQDRDREETFDHLVEKLRSDNAFDDTYKLYTYRYPTNAPIQEASEGLWNLLDSNNDIDNPVILAHSMGGVVARKLMLDHEQSTIRALITLGTPHEGTPMSNILTDTSTLLDVLNQYCPNVLSPVACASADIAKALQSKFLAVTPGVRDLDVDSNLIQRLTASQGDPNKIYTLGGRLGTLSAIADFGNKNLLRQIVYQLGYLALNGDNDGLVTLNSATPNWSTEIASLKNHDHTEMVRGEDYDEVEIGSITNELIPLLKLLAIGPTEDSFIYASSANYSEFFGASSPSYLYSVHIAPEGRDFRRGLIKTQEGYTPEITDIANGNSDYLWGISYESLYRINSNTALGEFIGDTDYSGINALALDGEDRLLALSVDGELIRLDNETGHGTLITELQNDWGSIGDITFGPDGLLYGIVGHDFDRNFLATINPSSGNVTPVNSGTDIGYTNVFGLTYFANTFYAVTTTTNPDGGYLIEIDPSTGMGAKIRSIDFQATGAGDKSRY